MKRNIFFLCVFAVIITIAVIFVQKDTDASSHREAPLISKLELKITGNGENDKSIWFEFKFFSEEKINLISLRYNVLFNEYYDQMNLLNVSTSSGDQSLIFNKSKPELKIKI